MYKPEKMRNILSFAAVLLLFIACNSKDPVQQDAFTEDITYEMINISGMSCTGCEETITAGVTSLEGVQEASADHVQGAAWVSYDASRVNHEMLTAAIESRGYKVLGFEVAAVDSTSITLN